MEWKYEALESDSASEVYSAEERVQADPAEYAVSTPCGSPAVDAFDEAFDGDHEIDYWFWNGARLIPASPDEAEHFRWREVQKREEALLASAQRRRTPRASQAGQGSPWRRVLSPLFACRDALWRVFGKRSTVDAREMGRGG